MENLEESAAKYGLSVDFVTELYGKVSDKDNFDRALKMFVGGHLPYDIATGKEQINVAEIRHNVARNLWKLHERRVRIAEYYAGCRKFVRHSRGVTDIVYVDGQRIVAFANFKGKRQGGIYMADNELMPGFRWNPHQALARLRKIDKSFYRSVKNGAPLSPREWFDFSGRTVRKRA